MIKLYGTANGFGWKLDEIIGAQVVSVPMAVPVGMADKAWGSLTVWLIGAFFGIALAAMPAPAGCCGGRDRRGDDDCALTMKRPLHAICRMLGVVVFLSSMPGPVVGAEAPPKAGGKAPAAAKAVEPPVGFWSDGKTDLYVSVEAGKSDSSEAMFTERRRLQLGGPPPSRNKADDVFIPEKFERRGNSFVATGRFNWDSANNKIEVEIAWTAQGVTVKIVTNPGSNCFRQGPTF